MQQTINRVNPEQHLIGPEGYFPNNAELPALHYKSAFAIGSELADMMEETFLENKWTNAWRNGIYDYHHYHSTAHEVLGVYSGNCKVQLGGSDGIILELNEGDVIVLPAGVAHKNVGCSTDFKCIGAYAGGRDYDMNYGKPEEIKKAKKNISKLPLPEMDPVYGEDGPLAKIWNRKK